MVMPSVRARALLDPDFPLPLELPFTSQQAAAAGVSRGQLSRLVRSGLVRRMTRNAYVAAQAPDTRLLRGEALALVVPAGCVVTDWTACWYWSGMDLPNSHLGVPPLSVFRPSDEGRLRNGLVTSGERWFRAGDTMPLTGDLAITTPLRTACDLGRLYRPIIALGGMDALMRHAGFSRGQLVGGVEQFRRQRGVVQLRTLAPLADGRSESMGESSLRWHWLSLTHLPAPEPQVPVTIQGITVFRIDLGVEELRYGAEYDGERFHGEEHRVPDERRRSRLSAEFGWVIDAFRRDDIYGPHETATTRLPRGVASARQRLARSTFPS